MNKKTLVVGLDAACWNYLDPLLRSGKMPTLKHHMDKGVWGTLHSTMPPWTPAAWSSIITGKNPGKHGIFDMLWKRPGSYEFTPTNATLRIGTPFWQTLNNFGIKTGVVNVPFTYPVKPVDGFLVCGFGTPNVASEISYPKEVADWISSTFPGFEPEVDTHVLTIAPPQEIFQAEKQQQTTFVEIAGELANRYQTDILVINLMFPDHANHKMPEMAQVQEAYCQTDRDLTRLIDKFCPDNVMIFSDHGSSRLKGDFMLDAWMQDQGYYVTLKHSPSELAATLNWLLTHYLQETLGWNGIMEKVVRRFIKLGYLRLPERTRQRLLRKLETVFPDAGQYLLWSGRPDHKSTPVFSGSVYSGLLYLNLVDREKNGVIPFDSRKKIMRDIASELMKIHDPETGEPIFANVYFAEDIYAGSEVLNAPDLILDAYSSGWNLRVRKDYFPAPPRSITERYFVVDASQRDFGWHISEGIFVFSGLAFDESAASFDASLPDLAATLLHLYSVPLPEDYDGLVRKEAMTTEYQKRPVKYQPSDGAKREAEWLSSDEEKALVSHLKSLGYLG